MHQLWWLEDKIVGLYLHMNWHILHLHLVYILVIFSIFQDSAEWLQTDESHPGRYRFSNETPTHNELRVR